MNGLIVVTHPDDDALFAAPYQLAHTNIKWSVICVTHALESRRFAEMRQWQKRCGARWTGTLGLMDVGDYGNSTDLRLTHTGWLETQQAGLHAGDVYDGLLERCGNHESDIVLTHNSAGEYGHPDHRVVHRVVRELVLSAKIAGYPDLLYFGWGMQHEFTVTVPTYVNAAVAAYETQAKVITHVHENVFAGCCGEGRYLWNPDARRRV